MTCSNIGFVQGFFFNLSVVCLTSCLRARNLPRVKCWHNYDLPALFRALSVFLWSDWRSHKPAEEIPVGLLEPEMFRTQARRCHVHLAYGHHCEIRSDSEDARGPALSSTRVIWKIRFCKMVTLSLCLVKHQAIETWWNGGMVPRIINLGIGGQTPRSLGLVPFGLTVEPIWTLWWEEKFLSALGMEPSFLEHPTYSLFTVQANLFTLPIYIYIQMEGAWIGLIIYVQLWFFFLFASSVKSKRVTLK
jgi:hypothetical protein